MGAGVRESQFFITRGRFTSLGLYGLNCYGRMDSNTTNELIFISISEALGSHIGDIFPLLISGFREELFLDN